MGVAISLVLIAAGGILKWGVAAHVQGVDLAVIGLILLLIGVLGLIVSIFLEFSHRRTRVADAPLEREVVRRDV